MLGSEFVKTYAGAGLVAWEAAVVELARQGQLLAWPWVDLPLSDDQGNTAVLRVQSDVVAVGTVEDHVRVPLRAATAQTVANLSGPPGVPGGALLPTPWLVYQIWRASPHKLEPHTYWPNLGADLGQYATSSARADALLAAAGAKVGDLTGDGKRVVISNLYKPRTVVIFGDYRPSPPAPDVFDDGRPIVDPKTGMQWPDRQPIQPRSNVHGDFYVDYSQLIQLVAGTCVVDGQTTPTEALYRHPTLSRLVSNEGPLAQTRYPGATAPSPALPGQASALVATRSDLVVPTVPGPGEAGFVVTSGRRGRNW
jgi:hypothetical protein